MSIILGCYGKLPAHGDFVWEGLPAEFVTPWDQWLQQQMIRLQKNHPDNWLDHYLTSPIWRFLLKDPALGQHLWCGIVLPSVDIVGRYYPLTIAAGFPTEIPFELQNDTFALWLEGLETIALNALELPYNVEQMIEQVRILPRPEPDLTLCLPAEQTGSVWKGSGADNTHWLARIGLGIVTRQYQTPCLWSQLEFDTGLFRFQLTEGFTDFTELFDVPDQTNSPFPPAAM